ncbi:MAG TPA: membrane protein insertase YidC [Polyangia bacterium]
MDKRVLMASVVSMGVVLIWIAFFGKPKHDEKKTDVAAPTASVATANPATAQAAADGAKEPAPKPTEKSAEKTDGPPAPPPAKATPVESTLELAKHYRATFTSEGAAPTHWVLLDKQYKVDNPRESNKQAEPIDLVKTTVPNLPLTMIITSSPQAGAQLSVPADAMWTPQPQTDPNVLSYVWEDAVARVEKRFTLVPGTYQVNLHVTIENKTDDKWMQPYVTWQLHGYQDPNIKPGGMFSKRVQLNSADCYNNGKVKRASFDELIKKGKVDQLGDVRWIAVAEQYFTTAIAVAPSTGQSVCTIEGGRDGSMSAMLALPVRNIHGQKPGPGITGDKKAEYDAVAFMGPKILSQLDAVQTAGASAHLGDLMEYGWGGLLEWLARPMLAVLKAIHFVLPNWGVAIIFLTIILKAVTWFPTQKSLKSMKAMAKLKPEMDKLKERFANDKNALNLATMELYKKHGVNPLGGCLPILIQMPIYIALYSMLGNSVELYRSPFVFWIRDLTAADPFFVLPIVTGLLMFVQQLTQPANPDQQQKMMMYLTPVMYTAFSIFLPAGLTIYILTNTLLTFIQQWLLKRDDKPARPKAVATKPARA